MKTLLLALLTFAAASVGVRAQSVDFGNLQVHGFATQSLLYSTNNNWATTNSSDGSLAWTEAVASLSAQPATRLRIGVQARYFLLGDYGNRVGIDWAQADYKVNEYFGLRAGKVKTPAGLFNEIQDIDPSFLWILLPQSVYPLTDRGSILAHNGGVLYGKVKLGETLGSLQYKAFGGQRKISSDNAYLQATRNQGYTLPNGLSGPAFGGSLTWNTPLPGLLVGATEFGGDLAGDFNSATLKARLDTPKLRDTFYFARYDGKRVSLAAEFTRIQYESLIKVIAIPLTVADNHDIQGFYVMASSRLTRKLSAGAYYASSIDRKVPVSSARHQKDWVLTTRFDINRFFYSKAEQHFLDGTQFNYSTLDNPSLQSKTSMTLFKLGVSF